MTDMEKKLAFLLATSPNLVLAWDCSYEEAARDLVANGVVPVVRCKDCKHMNMTGHYLWCKAWERIQTMGEEGFCCFGERRTDNV